MELWGRDRRTGRWQLYNHCAQACEGSRPTQLRKPAACFPTACPVNAKTKHLPAPCRGRAAGQNEHPEGWQMPWHPASPSWAPTLPLSVAHPMSCGLGDLSTTLSQSWPSVWRGAPPPRLALRLLFSALLNGHLQHQNLSVLVQPLPQK